MILKPVSRRACRALHRPGPALVMPLFTQVRVHFRLGEGSLAGKQGVKIAVEDRLAFPQVR